MEKQKNRHSAYCSIRRLAVGLMILLFMIPMGFNHSGWLISSVKACTPPPPPPPPPPPTPDSGVTDPEAGSVEETPPEETEETASGNDNAATGADPILLRTGEFTFSRHDAVVSGRGIEFPLVRYYRGFPASIEETDYTGWLYFVWDKSKDGYQVSLQSFSVTPATGYELSDLDDLGFSSDLTGRAVRFEPGTDITYTLNMQICVTKSGYMWTKNFTEKITMSANLPNRYVSCLSRGSENTSPRAGWSVNFDMHLIEYPVQGEIHFHAGDGNVYVYTFSPETEPSYGDVWRCPKTHDFLKVWSNGRYTLVRKGNELLEFDKDGYIRQFRRQGKAIQFFYAVKETGEDNTLDRYGLCDIKRLDYILDDCQRRTNFYYADTDETYSGNLTSIVDWRGNTWKYDYYTTGNLKSVTDPNGYRETYFYTANGYLEKVQDGDGNIWIENNYNAETDRIDSQTLDGVATMLSYDGDTAVETDPNGVDTTYVMNENGLPLSKSVETETGAVTTYFEYDDYGERTKIIYPEGNGYDFAYDEKGNLTLISQVSSDPQDPNLTVAMTYEDRYHQLKSVTDPRGYTTTYTYDYEDPNYTTDRGLLVRIAYPEVTTDAGPQQPQVCVTYNNYNQVETVTGPDGIVLKYAYCEDTGEPNTLGLVERVILDYGDPNNADFANITYTFDYNQSGRVVDVNDPFGNTTTLTYNALDLLTEIENPAGHVTKMTYTADRRLAKVQRGFEAGWQEYDFGYNMLAKLNRITDSLGRESTVDYDDRHLVSAVTDANGNTTSKRYNTRKLVKEIIDAENGSTRFDYDDNGQLAVITDAEDADTIYEYDGYGRLEFVTYADDSYEQYGYDASSNLTSFRNRAGEVIAFEYDALNRVISKAILDTELITNGGFDGRSGWAQDGATFSDGTATFNGGYLAQSVAITFGRTYRVEFDLVDGAQPGANLGILLGGDYPDDQVFPDISQTGRILLTMIAGADNTHFWFRADNLTVPVVIDNVSVREIMSETDYQYDIAGRLVDVSQDTDQMTFDYDRLGRLEESTDQNGYTVGYEYDVMGRGTMLTYPNAMQVFYAYDDLGRLDYIHMADSDTNPQILAKYTYDELSRRTTVEYNYNYTADTGISPSYDGKMSYTYVDSEREGLSGGNQLGPWLKTIESDTDNNDTADISYTYTYDMVGNRTAVTDNAGDYSYGYDNIYQLTSADYPTNSLFTNLASVIYDNVYNRVTLTNEDHTPIEYVANAVNQYTSVGTAGSMVTHTYDDNGNLANVGYGYEYTYDAENRLINICEYDDKASYAYDSFGRRIWKLLWDVDGTKITYVYDGPQVIAEYERISPDTQLARTFIYGPGIDEPIMMIDADTGSRYYYFYDGLGSVAALSNTNGNIVEGYTYDAFGKVKIHTSAGNDNIWLNGDAGTDYYGPYVGNPYMFTGRRYDPESGLYYYRARMYNPKLGRFLQTDPAGYVDGMNLYAYVNNNPINWVDPWGLFQFGYRAIDGQSRFLQHASWFAPVPIIGGPGLRAILNYKNVEVYHEAGFYEDGSGDVADYGGAGRNEDKSKYTMRGRHYDDDLMRQAQRNVDAEWEGPYDKFSNNCQDYCSALRKEYKRLYKELNKEEKKAIRQRIRELKESEAKK